MVERVTQTTTNYTPGYGCSQCGAKSDTPVICCNNVMTKLEERFVVNKALKPAVNDKCQCAQ